MTPSTALHGAETPRPEDWTDRPVHHSLDGRVAVITGSSRGIGEAVARQFAAAGAAVVVSSSRSREAGEAVATSLPHAIYIDADVARPSGAEGLIEAAAATWGRVDALVNCAGISRRVPFEDLDGADEQLWQRCLDVHVKGVWNTVRAAARLLRQSDDGSVTNITSIAGSTTTGNSIPYTVSKAGADHLTRLLARALAPRVRVNAVAPGYVRTQMTAALPAAYLAEYERRIPLGRGGEPADVAEACLLLATSRHTTGTTLSIDGGVRVR
jgi:ketoreductase RED2